MKKQYFLLASLALGMAACTNDTLTPDEIVDDENNSQEEVVSNLQHARLSSFNSSQSRVTVIPTTRAAMPEGSLELVAEIENVSKEGRINGFTPEDRYLSATCVYYDKANDIYYTSYHMQGNNYNTNQTDETSGYLETFTLDSEGHPLLHNIYQPENPSELDFDFNHIYFDDLTEYGYVGEYTGDKSEGHRIIAVGHLSEPSSKVNGKPNTKAIIAQLDLENSQIIYAPVLTGDKLTDGTLKEDGTLMSLGDEDAGDVNCVLRKYDYYYLATRKGLAVVNAKNDNLFAPFYDRGENPHIYFLRTPGSAKYLSQPFTTSNFSLLYLTENTPANFDGNTEIPANIAHFAIPSATTAPYLQGKEPSKQGAVTDVSGFNMLNWGDQDDFSVNIKPVDGKNVFLDNSYLTAARFVCLGKNGLYVHDPDNNIYNETITFTDDKDGNGSRPVNGIFIEDYESESGNHTTDGFIYVANGSCLTILERKSLEIVAEFSVYEKGKVEDASANFVNVVKTENYTDGRLSPDRLVTVAFGQEGVKVFRFVPPTKY